MITKLFGILFFVVAAIGFWFLYRWIARVDDRRGETMRQLGAAQALTYWKGQAIMRYPNAIMLGKRAAYVQHALVSDGGIEMGFASFTIESGSSTVTVAYNYLSVQLATPSHMYLLIDSRRNNLLSQSILDTANATQGLEQFVLEGDFPQSYKVYGVKGSQIQTLQLLNPKAMVELIDNFLEYDIEITSDTVYLYSLTSSDSFMSAASIEQNIEDGNKLRQFMSEHTARY